MIAMFVAFLTSTEIDLPEDQRGKGERRYRPSTDIAPPSPSDEAREPA
jgi:hypothetical protein